MSTTSIEHVAVTCTVELSSAAVDAGAPLTLSVTATSEPHCDLEGQAIEIRDAEGAVVATGSFGPYDETADTNSTGTIEIPTPLTPGDYQWSATVAAYQDAEVSYDAVSVPVAFTTRAHKTTLLVWDVPTAITAGQRFTVKVGVKCSSGCRQAHRPFTILDHAGKAVKTAEAGDAVWPKSDALYFTELELKAPKTAELLRWTARCDETDLAIDGADAPIAHTGGEAGFDVRVVKRPDHKVRVEAWDGEKQVPLAGARVMLHPYAAVTDDQGVAEVEVTAGDYRVFVSRPKYTTYGAPVTVTADVSTKIELFREPPPNRE